ncbi:uncharacterized protein LOC123666943 [Melitaea cinxia]|uniref:uncharacterized protein LOC123666942 n=1 Tax=Melitaea cinxia TaxID=113334 RepID=UPI001E27363A|nr:uncharacterized protein LOC123666942 [Melitaea cinxia]XP_045456912.1 uncharacterized protein LOC123666943 [Melitaea cinxia]
MERTDIALARVNFLRKVKKITNWDKVDFLDETWLNANHTVSKAWTDDTTQSTTKVPEGKDNLKEPHYIIMDNAPYHSVQKHKPPTSANRKLEIIAWLQEKGIEANETMLKNELLRLVGLHKPSTPTYVLDDIAQEKGHNVIRLPPYHCQYNPIELIWAQVKGYAARSNITPPFTANKMLQLLNTAVKNVSAEDWKKEVTKCRKLMEEDWERDVRFDNICDQEFIINLKDCSSDFESDSEIDLGCTPLE